MHKKQDTQTPNFQSQRALFLDSNQPNDQRQFKNPTQITTQKIQSNLVIKTAYITPPPKEDQKQSQYPQGGFLPNTPNQQQIITTRQSQKNALKTPPSREQQQQQQKLNPSNIYKIQNNIKVEINNNFQATSQLFNSSGKGGSGSFKGNKAKPVLEGTDRLVQLINEAISFSKKDPEPIYWTNLFRDATIAKGDNYKCLSQERFNGMPPIANIEYKRNNCTDIKIFSQKVTKIEETIDATRLSSALQKIKQPVPKEDPIYEFPLDFHQRIEEISGLFSLSKLDRVRSDDINNYIESFHLLNELKKILKQKNSSTPKAQQNLTAGQSTIDKLIDEKGHFINHLSKSGYYKTKSEYAEENRNNCNKFPICFHPRYLDDEPFKMSEEVASTRFSFPDTSNQKVKFFTKLQKNYIEDIKQQLKNNSSVTVISGPPGSGKTDLIKFLTESNIADVKKLLDIENGSDIKFSHLNYGSFYTYDNYGKKKEKSEADIKGIIDELIANKSLITNQSENQKLLLFVDEWGVMYPKYAINYLKEKQLQSGNIAIIGVTAHQEPAKALLDHESGKGIEIQYINPQILARSENNNQNTAFGQNDEFIVDFTREINDYTKFQSFLTDSSILLPAIKPYIIINQYKDPADNSDKYMLAKVYENEGTIISIKKNNGHQSSSYHALNKKELLEEVNKIKKTNRDIKTIYHYSFSVARGGDMGMVPEGQNKIYKVILSDLSSVNFVDNLEQALTRDRSFNVQDLSDTTKKINIKCFKRNEKNGLEEYSPQEIAKKINDRNNFFNLNDPHNQNSDNGSRNSDLSTDISEEDRKFLMEEINSQSEEDKNITKIIVSYLDLIKKLPDSIDKKKSIDLLIENNKESTANFMVCYNRAKTIERLIDPNTYKREPINYPIQNSTIKSGQAININQSALFIKIDTRARGGYELNQVPMDLTSQYQIKQPITLSPLNQKQNLSPIPEENSSQKEGDLSTQQQDLQSNSFNSKNFRYLTQQQISTQNLSPPEQQNSCSCCKIAGVIIGASLIGGIGYGFYRLIAGHSTRSVSVVPASPVTPNNPVTSNGMANLHWHLSNANHDLNTPNQPTNTNQITSISKNSHLNHLTHAHHLGISKISAISTSCSLTKAGTIAKAGLLACTFTPLLAVAGIGAVGYLGYKAYDYYYGTSDKINEEIANENPSNNIKTANCKALKEISLRK